MSPKGPIMKRAHTPSVSADPVRSVSAWTVDEQDTGTGLKISTLPILMVKVCFGRSCGLSLGSCIRSQHSPKRVSSEPSRQGSDPSSTIPT